MALPTIPTGWIHTWLTPLYAWLLTVRAAIGAFLGTSWEPVRCITQGALPANSYNGTTKRKTASANGALTIDGLAMRQGDRFWDNSAGTGSQRGLFVVEHPGSASSAWTAIRATDADTSGEFTQGKSFVVLEGTAAGRVYQLTNASFTLDTTTPAIGQDTLMRLGAVQTITGRKDFAASTLAVDNNSTTNAHLLASSATAARTATLPDKSGTIAFTDDVSAAPVVLMGFGVSAMDNNTFYLIGAGGNAGLTELPIGMTYQSGTKMQFNLQLKTAPGVGKNLLCSIEKSGDGGNTWTATGVSFNITGASTQGNSGEFAVASSAGDVFAIKCVADNGCAAAGAVGVLRLY